MAQHTVCESVGRVNHQPKPRRVKRLERDVGEGEQSRLGVRQRLLTSRPIANIVGIPAPAEQRTLRMQVGEQPLDLLIAQIVRDAAAKLR